MTQQVAKYKRIPLEDLRSVTSGDLIEVEMVIDSKNDYEYLLLEDHKPSGFEPDDQRSGYVWEGLRAYRELRDDRVSVLPDVHSPAASTASTTACVPKLPAGCPLCLRPSKACTRRNWLATAMSSS